MEAARAQAAEIARILPPLRRILEKLELSDDFQARMLSFVGPSFSPVHSLPSPPFPVRSVPSLLPAPGAHAPAQAAGVAAQP